MGASKCEAILDNYALITHVLAAIRHHSESGCRTIVVHCKDRRGSRWSRRSCTFVNCCCRRLLANELAEAQMALAVHLTLVR